MHISFSTKVLLILALAAGLSALSGCGSDSSGSSTEQPQGITPQVDVQDFDQPLTVASVTVNGTYGTACVVPQGRSTNGSTGDTWSVDVDANGNVLTDTLVFAEGDETCPLALTNLVSTDSSGNTTTYLPPANSTFKTGTKGAYPKTPLTLTTADGTQSVYFNGTYSFTSATSVSVTFLYFYNPPVSHVSVPTAYQSVSPESISEGGIYSPDFLGAWTPDSSGNVEPNVLANVSKAVVSISGSPSYTLTLANSGAQTAQFYVVVNAGSGTNATLCNGTGGSIPWATVNSVYNGTANPVTIPSTSTSFAVNVQGALPGSLDIALGQTLPQTRAAILANTSNSSGTADYQVFCFSFAAP